MKKRFLGIICFVYAFIIVYVIITNTLKNFLAPKMQIYLIISLIPLLLMGIVLCFSKSEDYKFKIVDLVLLLPLVMLVMAGDGRLSVSNLDSHVDNNSKKVKTLKEEKKEEDKEEGPKEIINGNYDFTNVDFDVIDESFETLATVITYGEKPSKFYGKTIRTRGFVLKKADYIPNKYSVLGKYLVNCCAADSQFIGFFIDYDKSKLKTNGWYEIEGVLEEAKDVAGYNIVAVKVINIKEIDKSKEEAYIYSCYAYGDGKCSELDKYQDYLK